MVRDSLGVASSLNTRHHELIFLGDGLGDSLLFLLLLDLVLDFGQVESHVLRPVSLTSCWRIISSSLNQLVSVGMAVVTNPDSESLLDVESDMGNVELAVLVVNLDVTLSKFVRHEDILVENAAHRGGSLIDAAPSLDVASLRLSITRSEFDWLLADDKDLLVFHLIVLILSLKSGLDVVFDLGLWLFTAAFVLESKRRWNLFRELRREANLVDAWLEHAISNLEDWLLELKELFALLQLLMMMLNLTIIIGSRPVADERALLATLDLKLDVGAGNSLHDFDVDETTDSVAWLIEGMVGLHLDLALREVAAFVVEEEWHDFTEIDTLK